MAEKNSSLNLGTREPSSFKSPPSDQPPPKSSLAGLPVLNNTHARRTKNLAAAEAANVVQFPISDDFEVSEYVRQVHRMLIERLPGYKPAGIEWFYDLEEEFPDTDLLAEAEGWINSNPRVHHPNAFRGYVRRRATSELTQSTLRGGV